MKPYVTTGLCFPKTVRSIDIDKYKIKTRYDDYQLLFQMDSNLYWCIGTYNNKVSAIQTAHAICNYLIFLNKKSEGLHVIEHILLRPTGQDKYKEQIKGEDFFSFKISVIFPAWTARCREKPFQMLAEETVCLNAPAHVYPKFYWLDFPKMYQFETLYEKWLVLKSNPDTEPAELNDSAQRLIAFLR